MSSLILIRHGQASLHGDDYDVLSDRGAEQSRVLGKTLASWGEPIDAAYSGPLRRHLDTARHLRAAASEAGFEIPEPAVLPGLREMDVSAVTSQAFERVLPTCPTLREQLASGALDDAGQEALRHVGGIIARLLERWARGEQIAPGMERYDEFAGRVQEALHTIMKTERSGRRVLIVTSGGPISVAVRMALGLEPVRAMQLLWSLANASLSELRYTESQLTVESFNIYSHLLADGLLTRI